MYDASVSTTSAMNKNGGNNFKYIPPLWDFEKTVKLTKKHNAMTYIYNCKKDMQGENVLKFNIIKK